MIYEWKCRVCAAQGEVVRTLDEYDVPPTDEEAGHWGKLTIAHEHEWVKTFKSSTPFEHLKNAGIFPDKYGNIPPRKME